MVLFSPTIEVAIGLLIGIALMKYSGYMKHISRELGYIASAAPFLLVAAVLPTVTQTFSSSGATQAIGWINMIFIIIAFILVLIGAITMAITIFSKLKP